MYLEYYSLERPPFRITPDPALFFTGGAHGRGVVLEALLYAVQSGEGILKVVGEVGSGKTMLCRMLEQRLPDTVEVVYLANPKLTPHDILYAVAFELKLDVAQETPRLVLMQKLQTYLLEQHAANRSVLVIIEEAQSMPLDTLEEIRLFSNLETHQHKLMQIILFGQPELDKNLQDKNIRQLRERITHSFHLSPLTPDEVSDYLRHRLQAAGCPAPQIFSKSAEKLIAKASGGLTRRINILADKAMLAAYSDSATATRPRSLGNQLQPAVTAQHVKAAIRDSDYKPTFKLSPWPLAVASLVVIIGLLAWQLFARNQNEPVTVVTSGPDVAAPVQFSFESAALPAIAPMTIESPPAATTVADVLPAATPASLFPATASAVPVEVTATVVTNVAEDTSAEGLLPLNIATAAAPLSPSPLEASEELSLAGLPDEAYPAILTARVKAFEELVRDGISTSYTLQLLSIGARESPFVVRTLELMNRSGVLDNTYACLTESQDGLFWRVVYGQFPTIEAARNSMTELPESIRNNQPFVQNLNRLQCLQART